MDTFFKSQHKYEHNMLDMIELARKLALRECCLETNSKEAHSYFLHPVYIQLKRTFSPYALSLMLHQMIESYKYIASEFEDDQASCSSQRFKVMTDRGGEFIVERNLITKRIYCGCSFHILNDMICAHSFCLMNAL